MNIEFGILTLIPPVVAILLCFLTKRVLLSLFIGIFSAGLIISGYNPFSAVGYSLDKIVISVTDPWNARLLFFNLLMGSGVAFIWRLGGSKALEDWATRKFNSRKTVGIGAWLLGILVFFNDIVNAAIVGNVFRDIFERKRISREKLSYILDSTAAPVATFFISDWIAFQISMVQSGLEAANINSISPFEAYLTSIPFNLYCILAVLLVGYVVYSGKDFGPMFLAERRARLEGKVVADDATPIMDVKDELGESKETKPMLKSFFIPVFVLISVTLWGFWFTGKGNSLTEILGSSDPAKALLWGGFAMTFSGMLIAKAYNIMSIKEMMETIIDGMKLMLLACAILILAWSLGGVTKDMNLSGYVVSILGDKVSYEFLPFIIFLIGMFIAFSTGTSWGAMTILTPVAIPLAYNITGDVYLSVVVAGAVFSGSIFGDHCSPISDTTVMSSLFSGSDHIDHVKTQIPYAILTALVSGVLYLLFGIFNINPFLLALIGIIVLMISFYAISNFYERKYN